jgi:hypothetical protein
MKTPEGHTYGPVTRLQLDAWVSEGRVSADCVLQDGPAGPWIEAGRVFPVLIPRPVAPPTRPAIQPNRGAPVQRAHRRVMPHRAPLILALGILSWLCCPVFGLFAWILGSGDLRDMRAGRMDPEGIPLTQAGQILGMIHIVLFAIVLVGIVFLLLMIGIASS